MLLQSRICSALATIAVACGNCLALIAPAKAECPRPREGAEKFVRRSHKV